MSRLVFIGDLSCYEKEIAGKRKRQYERLLSQAERYRNVELPKVHPKESTTYMGMAIVNLALAYRLSKEDTYLLEAKRFIHTVLSYEKWGNAHLVNVDLSASWILFGLSLGYDWLKPYLTEDEKNKVAAKIKHHAEIIYTYRRNTYGSGWSTNFYQNHNWINMTGLAAAGYALVSAGEGALSCERASVYIQEAEENFSRVFSYLADDGSNYEGVPYWRYGGMWLFVYAHLLKTQGGRDYFKSSDYLKNTFYYRLYQSCGDLRQQLNFGDSHDRYSGHSACVYYKAAAEYGDGFAQKLGNLTVNEFLMEEAGNSKIKPGILPEAAFEFLWYEPEVPERELSLLPTVRYFEDMGLLSIRENWSENSKVLSMKCGYPGGKKQWLTGFKLMREEGIDCLSLSHHHPDNLSYIFADGSEYLTCEDGYNRNLMPDNHNVILVDDFYTDAFDVNDVYVSAMKLRMEQEGGAFSELEYGGTVTAMEIHGSTVIYRGETSGVYPKKLDMKEVSRLLFTDGLSFWIFIDICRSGQPHRYRLISNTDRKAESIGKNAYRYAMKTGAVNYHVFSDKPVQDRQYCQEIVSVMTTQEPDKVCKTSIETLSVESVFMEKVQMFAECFTFENENTQLEWEGNTLTVRQKENCYVISCVSQFPEEDKVVTPIQIRISGNSGQAVLYRV